MSRRRNTPRGPPNPAEYWDSPITAGPTVVNATLNVNTNEFDVTEEQPRSNRSKFNFGANNEPSDSWAFDAQQGWGSGPIYADTWNNVTEADQHVAADRFSKKEVATFRLNAEISEVPVFTKVTDYTEFREKTILPNYEDLMLDPVPPPDDYDLNIPSYRLPLPNIPVNKTKNAYDSVDQYLYTHFELMRNDCLIPLQKAVRSYRETHEALKDTADYGEAMEANSAPKPFRLYEHVHINSMVFGSRQVLYRVSFRLPYYVRVTWEQSKRLMPGSLVLLSKDHFKTDLKVATVVERGDKPMAGSNRFEFMIDIYLEQDNPDMPLGFGDPLTGEEDTYVMIEATDGYFEAYRHVLSVFKNLTPNELPFSDYLVKLSNEVLVPYYANKRKHYDINVLTPMQSRQHERWTVDITNPWPSFRTGMDKTQMDALRTILTNNLAIVQGPPGTGKTYVGTYAMRVLLTNFDTSIGPIVCICQTNHALDQFLEHVFEHDPNIVRVGGRSKSSILKEHTLYELKKQHESPKKMAGLYRTRDEMKTKIKRLIIEMYEKPCVTIDYINKINGLRPRQLDSLKRIVEKEKKAKDTNSTLANFDDSDDDFIMYPDEPVLPAKSATKGSRRAKFSRDRKGKKEPPKHQKQQQQQSHRRDNTNLWAGGNPNTPVVVQPAVNPVELWLKDAIEYVTDDGAIMSLANDLKEDLLETDKGLDFGDTDDRELIEEEELEELQQAFKGEDQDRSFMNEFIRIGKAFQKTTESEPGERPERKVVNYKKTVAQKEFDPSTFSFFDDDDGGDDSSNTMANEPNEPNENDYHILERWTKEDDVSMWPLSARLQAHKRWVNQRNTEIEATIVECMRRYVEISKDIRKIWTTHEAKICRENRVVGMTSTAAAKYHDLLEAMKPRIMVVEEAAEMLESHIISALTKSLEHLILIGDHQQLRPSTAVNELSEQHSLSVSLFERLVMNNFPFTRLSHQRRMRPEIRMLINPIYKDPPLQDHTAVTLLPPIRGMDQSLFFLSHQEPETHLTESASKVNEHEAKMAAKLSVYLLLQGYRSEDITIITMYSGQKSMIRRALRDERRPEMDPSEIFISSVDGYQGEENKIIILSLVRSNVGGQIGFLKVANRVCVSLSRAKQGMYILGNASLLCERSDLWNEIVASLEDHSERHDTNHIGTKLVLKCSRHQAITEVQWPVDFSEVEQGGCTKLCGEDLPCGHKCELKCHPYDHSEVDCKLQCQKILECTHRCLRQCYQSCGPCLAPMAVRLPCQHILNRECGFIRRIAKDPSGQRCPECRAPLA